MSEMLVLGAEALGAGAIDAGITAAYGYPGTPSTEIMEFLQEHADDGGFLASWCTNEKTSYEGAVGVSYAGRRVLVSMKHVGLNVAADAFINSALLKINGGLVLAVADDPGMHSSQNEQDSRFYADFAGIICFEPRNHQEIYEMTLEAFNLSEKFHIPVMVKLVTRLSHSRAVVKRGKQEKQKPVNKPKNSDEWMTLPALSRKSWKKLLADQEKYEECSERSPFNVLEINSDFTEYGIITSGLGTNYYLENIEDLSGRPSHLRIGMYPVPDKKIVELSRHVKKVVLIEEGYPFIENQLRSILPETIPVSGKMDGMLPRTGELNPDNVRKALGLSKKEGISIEVNSLPGRPPQLCQGCSHRDTYEALSLARSRYKDSIVTSDIGCYALGALPPYKAIETILCMGASIGMAKGAAEAGCEYVVATIGDSTFLHSGITSLIDAYTSNTNMTVIIMDNSTTAMTGGQKTILSSPQIERLVRGVGVPEEHLRVINPLKKHLDENVEIIRKEMEYRGLSVIISLRECIQTAVKRKKGKK